MKVIPAIDLLDSKVVRLSQGDYHRVTVYSEDPLAMAEEFSSHGFSRLHIVDLSGAKDGEPFHTELISSIKKATRCEIEMGGGIRTYDQVKAIFEECLNPQEDQIMLGSLPFKNPHEMETIVTNYSKNILLTLDVWGEMIRISGWRENLRKNIFSCIPEIGKKFALSSFLVTQIKSDGLMKGPDVRLYQRLLEKYPSIQLFASGGVAKTEDIKSLADHTDVKGVIVGKAIYENKIQLEEINQIQYQT